MKEYWTDSECKQCQFAKIDYCHIPDELITYCTKYDNKLIRVWKEYDKPCIYGVPGNRSIDQSVNRWNNMFESLVNMYNSIFK